MQGKPLLLPSRSPAPRQGGAARAVRLVAIALGTAVVLFGAADVAARVAQLSLGDTAGAEVFGPAAFTLFTQDAHDESAVPVQAPRELVPARLRVPSLGIDAAVEQVGKKADGSMGTPKEYADVAWYAPGARPGAPGSAVMAGHVNNGLTKVGVFAHLSQVDLGATIEVADTEGRVNTYTISHIEQYPADHAPEVSEAIFAAAGPSRLVLITCDGSWVASKKTFANRLVVTAEPLLP